VGEIEHCCITAVCWNSFFGLIVKAVGSYFVSRFGRQNRNSGGRRCRVYERCQVYGRGRVYGRCRVYGHCRVYRRCRVWTDVEPVGAVRGSSGATLNLLEMQEVRLVSRGTCAWRERLLTTRECDRWLEETRDLVPARPSTRWTSVESTVGSFGSSSTESPADVTDDRPPWRTRFEAYFFFLLFVYFVMSVVVLISKVLFFILKISLFISLNLSHSNSSSC